MTIEKINEQIKEVEAKLADPNLAKGTVNVSSRISGYYRPLNAWNNAKTQEFHERAEYSL